ncbi:MAG: hypothetical protein WAL71_20325 [Terriglobales bacterium]
MESKPTHEQAKLQLELYDMRREARLRQAREWFMKNYFVESIDDSMRIAMPGTETGTFAMMVVSYWEQVCSMLNYGLLHEEMFFETNGEFFMVWERAKPMVPGFREKFAAKHFLANLEKAAQRYEAWIEKTSPGHMAKMREFTTQMRSQAAKVA